MGYIHIVGRVRSFFSSRWNWDSPNPSPASECAPPPPLVPGGGAHAHAREGGWASPSSNEETYTTLYMYVLCEYIHGKVYSACPQLYRQALPSSVITKCTSLGYYVLKYLVATATLFYFLFYRFAMRRIHFTYRNFAWGLHGGLKACLFWSCIDVIVVRVKVSRGIVPFSPMGIDSADTNQLPKWGDLHEQITFTSK